MHVPSDDRTESVERRSTRLLLLHEVLIVHRYSHPCEGTDPSLGGVHETLSMSGPATTTDALDGGDTPPEPPASYE